MVDTTLVPLLNMIFKLRAVLGFGTALVPCLVCIWTAQDTKNKFYSSFSIIKTILLNSKRGPAYCSRSQILKKIRKYLFENMF